MSSFMSSWGSRGAAVRFVVLLLGLLGAPVEGQLSLHRVFGEGMVLQRDRAVRVFGRAEPGAEVTLSFAGRSRTARTGDDGRWTVALAAMPASHEGRSLRVASGGAELTVEDVLVGEVWICGGQSNMEWTMRGSVDADVEIPSADSPSVRFLRLPKVARYQMQSDLPEQGDIRWRPCTPEHVQDCTAVGYYFARRLGRRLGVPVGLIDTSWGGTMAQHWVPAPVLRKIPEMKTYFDSFEKRVEEWDAGGGAEGAARRREEDLARWEKDRAAAVAAGTRPPGRPRAAAYEDPRDQGQPGGMFNGVIAPLVGLAIRGVLFYQGENNSFGESWKPFPKTYPAVIRTWRQAFGDDALPFGLIQIAGWSTRRSMTYDMNHHTNIVREVQHLTWQRTPGTGLVVTFDANSNRSIHPGRKLPVGERSARWALAEVYGVTDDRGRPLEWRGPVYAGMRVEGGRVSVKFEPETARGLRLDQDAELGFYLAGEDRVFHVARARVQKDEVQVWSDEVPEPVAVRYAWSNLPLGSLMNARELPAYPFRSDDWPLVPHQSKGAYEVKR